MAALVRGMSERIIMAITIYRGTDLFNTPARKAKPASNGRPARCARPAKRGKLNVGKSHFFDVIEPQLEKVQLGPKAVGYTDQSVDKFIEKGIAAAIAERDTKAA
jgi:hypothetical protein